MFCLLQQQGKTLTNKHAFSRLLSLKDLRLMKKKKHPICSSRSVYQTSEFTELFLTVSYLETLKHHSTFNSLTKLKMLSQPQTKSAERN